MTCQNLQICDHKGFSVNGFSVSEFYTYDFGEIINIFFLIKKKKVLEKLLSTYVHAQAQALNRYICIFTKMIKFQGISPCFLFGWETFSNGRFIARQDPRIIQDLWIPSCPPSCPKQGQLWSWIRLPSLLLHDWSFYAFFYLLWSYFNN